MEEQGYNGWSNYPTWDVALWIGNEEGLYDEAQALTRAAASYHGDRTQQGILADNLKAWVEELDEVMGAPTTGYVADLYGWAFSQVDWYEIAEHYLQEVSEDA